MYEEKSRRYKRVKRADEPIQGLGASCVFIHIFAFAIFIALFRIRIGCLCRRQLNPNRESKDSSMDALLCTAAAAVFSSAYIQSNDAMIKQNEYSLIILCT